MIIHTNAPAQVLYDAAWQAGAFIRQEKQRGSRTHDHAYEVTLVGGSALHSNRRAMNHQDYAATWDQWGVFLSRVFHADPDARCGSAKRPTYANIADFHTKTSGRFAQPGLPADYHGDHSWVPGGRVEGTRCRRCSAVDARWVV